MVYDGHDYVQIDPFADVKSVAADVRTSEDFINDYILSQYEQDAMLRAPVDWGKRATLILLIAAIGVVLVLIYGQSNSVASIKILAAAQNHSVTIQQQELTLIKGILNGSVHLNITRGIT